MTALNLGQHFQIGYVTRDIDRGTRYLTHALGAVRLTRFDDVRLPNGEPSSIGRLSHFHVGSTEFEIIEPRVGDSGSIYAEALPHDEAAISIHHLGYLLPDIESWREVVAQATSSNIPVPSHDERPGVAFAYLDTRQDIGHYTEVVYRAPGMGPGGIPRHVP